MHYKLMNIYFCFLNASDAWNFANARQIHENVIDFIVKMILCSIITTTDMAAAIQLPYNRQRHRVQQECKEMIFKKTGFHVFFVSLNFITNCYVSASLIMTYVSFIHIFIAQ